jgi:hypothetical protein
MNRNDFTAAYRALRTAHRNAGLGDTRADWNDDLRHIAAVEARHPVAAAALDAADAVDPLITARQVRSARVCPF